MEPAAPNQGEIDYREGWDAAGGEPLIFGSSSGSDFMFSLNAPFGTKGRQLWGKTKPWPEQSYFGSQVPPHLDKGPMYPLFDEPNFGLDTFKRESRDHISTKIAWPSHLPLDIYLDLQSQQSRFPKLTESLSCAMVGQGLGEPIRAQVTQILSLVKDLLGEISSKISLPGNKQLPLGSPGAGGFSCGSGQSRNINFKGTEGATEEVDSGEEELTYEDQVRDMVMDLSGFLDSLEALESGLKLVAPRAPRDTPMESLFPVSINVSPPTIFGVKKARVENESNPIVKSTTGNARGRPYKQRLDESQRKRWTMSKYTPKATRAKLSCSFKGCHRVGEEGFTRIDYLRQHLRNVHGEDIPKNPVRFNGCGDDGKPRIRER